METEKQVFYLHISLRSYPTYEEWKHGNKIKLPKLGLGSYPTYEEWKH